MPTTKEEVIPETTVKLVRKIWRPEGFDPGTDEPLQTFPGNIKNETELNQFLSKRYGYVEQPLISATKLFDDSNYNSSLPSVILTHPVAFPESNFIFQTVVGLTLRNLQKHYNVFTINAFSLAIQFQLSCMRLALGLDPLFKPVAEAFATFLLDGILLGKLKPHHISFIGYSYSATLNAYIAREIRKNTGQLVHTLMSLDAYQMNKGNRFFKPVSKEDAMFVHMIHTNSKTMGTFKRIGTVDIVANNGYIQPGCLKNGGAGAACNHRRVVTIFLMALLAQGNIVARQCDSWEQFSQCECSNNPMLIVSFPVNEEARGIFYVRTDKKYPYALETKGAYCEAEANKLVDRKT